MYPAERPPKCWRHSLCSIVVLLIFSLALRQALYNERMATSRTSRESMDFASPDKTAIRILNHKIGTIYRIRDDTELLESLGEQSERHKNATEAAYWTFAEDATSEGKYYALETTPERSRLCKKHTKDEDFLCGPILGQSVQPFALMRVRDRYLMIFFTLQSDARLLVGTVDTQVSNDWNEWRLLPGATLLNQPGVVSRIDTTTAPRFVLDANETNPESVLSGYLYHTVEGDAAVSKLELNLTQWLDVVVKNRDRTSLPSIVLSASSLSVAHVLKDKSASRKNVLVTGVGRSGTGVLCKVFQEVGLNVSHDNDKDCGPYPGSDGAVSWFDAFRFTEREYDTVLHLVRDPLLVILSRASTMLSNPRAIGFLRGTISGSGKEDFSNVNVTDADSLLQMATKHWARRNSFVEAHAEWRERTEDLNMDPLCLWRMCMASYFGERCPPLVKWKAAHEKVVSLYTNSLEQRFKGAAKRVPYSTWEELAASNNETAYYVKIAREMGVRYGYSKYQQEEQVAYSCGFGADGKWDCQLV